MASGSENGPGGGDGEDSETGIAGAEAAFFVAAVRRFLAGGGGDASVLAAATETAGGLGIDAATCALRADERVTLATDVGFGGIFSELVGPKSKEQRLWLSGYW